MKVYYVKITGYAPYPVTINYYERASNWATAIRRATAKYFKDYQKKGKMRIKNLSIQVGRGLTPELPTIKPYG